LANVAIAIMYRPRGTKIPVIIVVTGTQSHFLGVVSAGLMRHPPCRPRLDQVSWMYCLLPALVRQQSLRRLLSTVKLQRGTKVIHHTISIRTPYHMRHGSSELVEIVNTFRQGGFLV